MYFFACLCSPLAAGRQLEKILRSTAREAWEAWSELVASRFAWVAWMLDNAGNTCAGTLVQPSWIAGTCNLQ